MPRTHEIAALERSQTRPGSLPDTDNRPTFSSSRHEHSD